MGHYHYTFYCDNCSSIRLSAEHSVRYTSYGTVIEKNVCERCGMTQEIEIYAKRKDDAKR